MKNLPPISLLVDIENIKISVQLEQAIFKRFANRELVKIAVANWKTNDYDVDLTQRGYHLLHVPPGKDRADLEIINLGRLVKDCGELIIVSNDKIFVKFAYDLNLEGKVCHLVYGAGDKYTIAKIAPLVLAEAPIDSVKIDSTNSPSSKLAINSQSEFLKALQDLAILDNTITTAAKLAAAFHKQYGKTVTSIMQRYQILGTFDLLVSNRQILTGKLTSDPKSKLIAEIKKIIEKHPNAANDSASMGMLFKKEYGISLSQKMKQIGINGNASKFLAGFRS